MSKWKKYTCPTCGTSAVIEPQYGDCDCENYRFYGTLRRVILLVCCVILACLLTALAGCWIVYRNEPAQPVKTQ